MEKFYVGEVGFHRLSRKTLKDFDFTNNELLRALIYDLIEREEWEKGIGLIGGVGVGKTHLLINLYKNRAWWAVWYSKKVPIWLQFYDLIMLFRTEGDNALMEVLDRGEIVFVDDFLSTVGERDLEKRVASLIVFTCYDKGKIFCFSSNFSLDHWDVDERVVDRLYEMCEIYEVVGTSKRRSFID